MSEDFLIGTYTKKDSQGMYAVTLDTENNQLVNDRLILNLQKPAYLQVASHNLIFTVRQEGELGGVASYQINNGKTTLIDKSLSINEYRRR